MYTILLTKNILQSSHPEVDIQYKCQQQPPCTFVTHHFQVLSFTAKDWSTWIIVCLFRRWGTTCESTFMKPDWLESATSAWNIFPTHISGVYYFDFSCTNCNVDYSDPLEPDDHLVDQGWSWWSILILILIILNLIMLIRAHVRDVHEANRSHQCRFSIESK